MEASDSGVEEAGPWYEDVQDGDVWELNFEAYRWDAEADAWVDVVHGLPRGTRESVKEVVHTASRIYRVSVDSESVGL